MHILPAAAKKTYKIDEAELAKLPLKKQMQIKKKMGAASSSFSWNSLYMNVSYLVAILNAPMLTQPGRRCHVVSS